MLISFLPLMVAFQGVAVKTDAAPQRSFSTPPAGMTFKGGPFDGLTTGQLKTKNGESYVTFIPSKPDLSPVPPRLKYSVDGLIDAYEKDQPSRYRDYVLENAPTYAGCIFECAAERVFVTEGFPFKDRCKANAPYYLKADEPANEAVRIEWICNGELWFLTYLHFQNGKIARVNSVRADPPQVAVAPRS